MSVKTTDKKKCCQKQSPEVFYKKVVLKIFCKIHRKTLVPESLC